MAVFSGYGSLKIILLELGGREHAGESFSKSCLVFGFGEGGIFR